MQQNFRLIFVGLTNCHLIEFNLIFLIGEGRQIIDTIGKNFSIYLIFIAFNLLKPKI